MRWLATAGLVMGVGVLFFASPTHAQSSAGFTVEQQISPLNCSYTTIDTGLGVIHDSTCPTFAPSIEQIMVGAGRPVIIGIFDAVHTRVLRIKVGDVEYVFGTDPELTAQGNVWMLDLSRLEVALNGGEHVVAVETEGDDGELRRAETRMNITSSDPTGSDDAPGDEPDTGDKEPGGSSDELEPATLEVTSLYSFLIPLLSLGLTFWLLFVLGRRRKRRNEHRDI